MSPGTPTPPSGSGRGAHNLDGRVAVVFGAGPRQQALVSRLTSFGATVVIVADDLAMAPPGDPGAPAEGSGRVAVFCAPDEKATPESPAAGEWLDALVEFVVEQFADPAAQRR